jgi:hypothetical protein
VGRPSQDRPLVPFADGAQSDECGHPGGLIAQGGDIGKQEIRVVRVTAGRSMDDGEAHCEQGKDRLTVS